MTPVYLLIMENEKLIQLRDVSIGYEGISLIDHIYIEINKGKLVGMVGPNGGGKSTLLKTLLGLVPPVTGRLLYKENITFGYVPQSVTFDRIFPLSVLEIVIMGRYARVPFTRKPDKNDMDIVRVTMVRTGIDHLKDRTFRSLSGGEKQRVLLARAIAGGPDIIAMDEPTASIDSKGEAEIMSLIKDMKENKEFTIIMVSHFIDSLIKFSDELVMVDKDRALFKHGDISDFTDKQYINEIFSKDITYR